ncbi:ubiquinol-cytochrome-c reductase complex assembly factor 4 isoform X2 [Anoplopoma fimbria]|uniref:ubiquinol-cytochrome-c reductase complex assembly factor 4 isoform X2 n=1 Tax=Anoplopoma fimbria TaxID=229290 RepID=UPI0023ED55ED|nr:ubiquinol-cytochrome-c reductase complex assembly factor 4 isoform X2 [Anoplopoma fimbria]
MSTTTGRVFTGLMRACVRRGIFVHNAAPTAGVNSVRSLALSSQTSAESKDGDKEVNNEPLKFSTSKASHRTWKVDHGMGSQYERPWWKVLPVSLFSIGFLLWCALRGQTDIDVTLEKELYEQLPGLLSEEDEEDAEEAKEVNKV